MDKSDRYINMCKEAHELNEIKWEYGFIDGDWLYLGNGLVRVIGSDTLKINQAIEVDENGKEIATINLIDAGDDIKFDTDGNDIDVSVLKYPIDSYVNPVWLPRQDQLESFYYQAIIKKIDVDSWIHVLSEKKKTFEFDQFKSMEQIALAVIMDFKFNKEWQDDVWYIIG